MTLHITRTLSRGENRAGFLLGCARPPSAGGDADHRIRRRLASPAADFRQEGASRMAIVITAFERSPDGGKGLARDTRVRWALEEVRQPYDVRLVSFAA